MGLTSRDGVAPLNLASDIAGPMARTVADAVAVFQVVAGEDAADTVTARSRGHRAADYATFLNRDALKGARIGVLHQAYDRETTDPEVVRVFMAALDDMRRQGATIVDPVAVPGLDARLRTAGGCNQFKWDINDWLARQGDRAPVHSLAEVIASRRFHPTIQARLEASQVESLPPSRHPGCASRDEFRAWLRTSVTALMDSLKLDALAYPTWSNPPRLIGDLNTPHGDNSQLFSPSTGFPAITVPMGYTRGQLPAGTSAPRQGVERADAHRARVLRTSRRRSTVDRQRPRRRCADVQLARACRCVDEIVESVLRKLHRTAGSGRRCGPLHALSITRVIVPRSPPAGPGVPPRSLRASTDIHRRHATGHGGS